MAKAENPVHMAVIGAPHGIAGEVRVKTFTGDPLALGNYGPLYTVDGRSLTIVAIRHAKNAIVVRFEEIASREEASALTGTELFIDRPALPDTLDDGEFYHADLIGLDVRDETGKTIATVTAVQNFGGGDIIEIALANQRAAMIPFTLAAIPDIRIQEGFMRIDRQAAGLTDNAEADKDESK